MLPAVRRQTIVFSGIVIERKLYHKRIIRTEFWWMWLEYCTSQNLHSNVKCYDHNENFEDAIIQLIQDKHNSDDDTDD